ncbi:MAG: EAL domain-containing protein [Steroidobacteraceae bacterium]
MSQVSTIKILIEAHAMLSFRNRLLILLLGLVFGAQTVTLFTALARTNATERKRADQTLQQGAQIAKQLLDYREKQLAYATQVLVKDSALRDAVATHDEATLASALGNHAERIGADLSLALDLDDNLLAHGEGTAAVDAELVASLNLGLQHSAGGARFVMSHTGVYQVFSASVPAPDEIGQLVFGLVVDRKLADELKRLVGSGVEIAFLSNVDGKPQLAAGTIGSLQDSDGAITPPRSGSSDVIKLGGVEYLATATHLSTGNPSLDIALLKSMHDVLAPFRTLAWNFALIVGITLAAAVVAGIYLGRSAARPVQRLADGAARVAAGDYSQRVVASGGRELAHLADSFNSMQSGIAERESQLLHIARHDSATGLPNRVQLEDWLTQRLLGGGTPPRIVVIQLVVTNLQEISATLGFEIAERLVNHLAQQLTAWNDGRGLVARLDTSAFAVAIDLPEGKDAEDVARQLQGLSSAAFTTAGVSLQAAVILGVALAPRDGATAAEALRCAHAAVEAANLQRCSIASFAVSSDEAQRRRLTLGADLPPALAGGQLFLHFQPKTRLADGHIGSVEALVRWQHPVFGLVSPVEFIPIAERTGASASLTRWVLQAALKQLASWHREGIPIEMAVNLSATDILDAGLLRYIMELLHDVRVPAGSLTLEITESVFMHEPEVARRNMELLRVAGVRFSIDDFGTGYSSLSQLRELAADELKIDQSFVRSSVRGPEHVAVLRAIIEMAHGLGLRTVAEGVETQEQWNLLAELGCRHAQGYLISKPKPASELLPLLQASRVPQTQGAERTESLRVLELRRRDS